MAVNIFPRISLNFCSLKGSSMSQGLLTHHNSMVLLSGKTEVWLSVCVALSSAPACQSHFGRTLFFIFHSPSIQSHVTLPRDSTPPTLSTLSLSSTPTTSILLGVLCGIRSRKRIARSSIRKPGLPSSCLTLVMGLAIECGIWKDGL